MIFIKRTYPAPESLAKEKLKEKGTYNCDGVHELLRKDFYEKCYICGVKPIQDGGEIEHLVAHKEYVDKKFDWDNLFLSCGHCNSQKNARKFDENVINCTTVDPSEHIVHKFQDNIVVITRNEDIKSITTAELIEKCFNFNNTDKRDLAITVRRNELMKEMNIFYSLLEKYTKKETTTTYKMINSYLQDDSQFTAFKRDYIRENSKNPKLIRLLDQFQNI